MESKKEDEEMFNLVGKTKFICTILRTSHVEWKYFKMREIYKILKLYKFL